MDVDIIVEAFIVVVIGGLGSFWGTFLGALIYGQVLSFGILIFPRFSIFAVSALMAAILIVRPWGLLGTAAHDDASAIPWSADRLRRWRSSCRSSARASTRSLRPTSSSWALFAMSLNLLLGYTGLVSFGHAAYFGDRRLHLRSAHEEPRRAVPARLRRRRA